MENIKKSFLEEYRKNINVKLSAIKIGTNRHEIYSLMRKDEDFKEEVEKIKSEAPFIKKDDQKEMKNTIIGILKNVASDNSVTVADELSRYKIQSRTFKRYTTKDFECKELFNSLISIKRFCKNCGKIIELNDVPLPKKGVIVKKEVVCEVCSKINKTVCMRNSSYVFSYMITNSNITDKKRFGHKNNLTKTFLEEMYQKQKGKCFFSKEELSFEPNVLNKISLDRIDSNKPHTMDNVVFCTWEINRMKRTMSNDYFVSLCKKIVEGYGE